MGYELEDIGEAKREVCNCCHGCYCPTHDKPTAPTPPERELPINAVEVISAGRYHFQCPDCGFAWNGNIMAAKCPECAHRNIDQVVRNEQVSMTVCSVGQSNAEHSYSTAPEFIMEIDTPIDQVISAYYRQVLAWKGGNMTRAAGSLGISVRTLQRHFKKQGKF